MSPAAGRHDGCPLPQVMPFTYIHLISFGSSIYCCVFALHKGLAFVPKETYIYGMVIPLFTVFLMNISLIGLIAIGQALANPLGGDSEDFAVLSFLESALQRSRQMLDANPAVPMEDDEAWSSMQGLAQAGPCSRADLSGKRRVSAMTSSVHETRSSKGPQAAMVVPSGTVSTAVPVDNVHELTTEQFEALYVIPPQPQSPCRKLSSTHGTESI